jgi:nucleotide-binding universal stress UspA family protein
LNDRYPIHRVLVALDASPHSRAALKAAAELAADFQTEILGMFIEDINLLRLAQLPCAREVAYATRGIRTVDSQRLERALRTQAAQLQHMLATVAQGRNVPWSFRVGRGNVAKDLLAVAEEGDVLVLGRVGTSIVQRARLGSTAQTVVATARHTVVFLEHGVELGVPVLVLFDGSEGAVRAMATAARLTRGEDRNLVVLLAGNDKDAQQRLHQQASSWLAAQGHGARFYGLAPGAISLINTVRRERGRTLVLAADHAFAKEETLADIMRRVRCPVVLTR